MSIQYVFMVWDHYLTPVVPTSLNQWYHYAFNKQHIHKTTTISILYDCKVCQKCFLNIHVYVITFPDRSHVCRDGHAVITDSSWVVLCPSTEDVTSQATIIVPGEPPQLLQSREIGTHTKITFMYATSNINFLCVV